MTKRESYRQKQVSRMQELIHENPGIGRTEILKELGITEFDFRYVRESCYRYRVRFRIERFGRDGVGSRYYPA